MDRPEETRKEEKRRVRMIEVQLKKWLYRLLWLFSLSAFCLGACTFKKEKGSKEDPILISLVPTKDAQTLMLNGQKLADWLKAETGLHFTVTVPTNYIAVVEAFGSNRADIGYLNTTSYFLAKDKYGVEAQFITTNIDGSSTYKGQIIVRSDSGIKSLADLQGKKIAYVDPTSASGYILPAYLLKSKGIKPAQSVFAGKHDTVVIMVYQKQVDAGATFHSRSENGRFMDARRLVLAQYPDVGEKIQILEFTTSLINDAMVFRKGLPESLKQRLLSAIEKWVGTQEGKQTLKALSNGSGLRRVREGEYDESRRVLEAMSEALADSPARPSQKPKADSDQPRK